MNDLETFKRQRFPQNTVRKVKWITSTFRDWHNEWSVRLDGGNKVFKTLDEMCEKELNFCLQFFFAEVRKVDGSLYPPRTLKEMAAGMQHYMNYERGSIPISIFKDKEFANTRDSLDAAMKASAAAGTVKPKKQASGITTDKESEMWSSGCFGSSNPQQLLDTMFFHLGIHLALRACQEHRNLIFGEGSQLTLEEFEGGERLKYVEKCSKNHTFGIHQANHDPKVTYIYPNPLNKDRCVINLYKKYISHRYNRIDNPYDCQINVNDINSLLVDRNLMVYLGRTHSI